MQINEKKSVRLRFGARFNADCENLRLDHGGSLQLSSDVSDGYVFREWMSF